MLVQLELGEKDLFVVVNPAHVVCVEISRATGWNPGNSEVTLVSGQKFEVIGSPSEVLAQLTPARPEGEAS